jgi:hypothetical protein
MSPGCGHGAAALELVRDVAAREAAGAEVEAVEVATAEAAAGLALRGSPTILVDGVDIDPGAPEGVGLG